MSHQPSINMEMLMFSTEILSGTVKTMYICITNTGITYYAAIVAVPQGIRGPVYQFQVVL